MFSFQNIVGNLYLACLFFQISILYDFNNSHIHNSLVLKSIDNVVNNIYFIKNQNVNHDVNQNVNSNISNICEIEDYTNWSNMMYSFLEYSAIFFISVIILEFVMLQNKTQGLFLSLSIICVYYGVIWKKLLNLWNINYYQDHIWLGIATVGFTTFSNSLANTKHKRTNLYEIFKLIKIPYSHFTSIYNYIYMLGLISFVTLCLLSNQHILYITLLLYIANLLLCPHYFLALFEIISIMYINIFYNEYYNLLALTLCFGIFILCNTFNYIIKDNIITIICIKTVGIFFNNIYVKYLC